MSKSNTIAKKIIKDIHDFFTGKKEPVMPAKVNWQGWESGCKVEYFNENEIATDCRGPCEKCGYFYLASDGSELKRNKEPLCGVWE